MNEDHWLRCIDPMPMLAFLRGKSSERKLRLLVVGCCRRAWTRLWDARGQTAVLTAERFADGNATQEELLAAYHDAWDTINDCVEHPAYSADQAFVAYLATHATSSVEGDLLYPTDEVVNVVGHAIEEVVAECNPEHADIVREVFGNPFRPVGFDPSWQTSTAIALADAIYDDRAFDRLPILADALQDAGCEDADILAHCRGDGPHVRGCWVVDLVLGKS